ncbi:MAG: hypothetical protein JNK04_12860 [Myxococcales bacterium]|nr:hypothetical protein [Myxococcales bacterium]
MSVDLQGWLEVRELGHTWSGFVALHPLIGASRALFPLLYQGHPTTGVRALQYGSNPLTDPSHEMTHLLAEAGLEGIPCFTVDGAELEKLPAEARGEWPRIDIELWWRDTDGVYHLKSKAHQLSRLTDAEARGALESGQPLDKNQYRYVVRHSLMTIDVPEEWQTLSRAIRRAVQHLGSANVRLIGFFE